MAEIEATAEGVTRARSIYELLESQDFIVAAIFGAAVVVIDATRRFNQAAFHAQPNDVIYSIAPRFLSTRPDYLNAYAVYVALRLLSYALPALAILHIFSHRGMTQALGFALPDQVASFITNENFPLFWGAVIAGVLPSFAFIRDVENSIRRFSHLTGSIPNGVRRLAQLLRDARLTPGPAFDRARLRTDRFAFLDDGDFDDARDVIERKWARVAFILDFFFNSRVAGADNAFVDQHRPELEREENRFRSLQMRFAVHKLGYDRAQAAFSEAGLTNLPRTISARDPFLEQDIDYLLERLEIYLACAVRFDENSDSKAIRNLRGLGFDLPETSLTTSGPVGGILAAAAAMVAAAFIGALTADPILAFTTNVLGFTEFPYEVVPGETILQRATSLLIYTLTVVSSILLGSFLIGATLFKIPRTEIDDGRLTDKPLLSYAAAALFGAACGLIALTALIIDPTQPLSEAGAYRWVWYWAPSFLVLGFMIHLFAYGPNTSLGKLFLQSAAIGAAFGFATYMSALSVFQFLGFDGAYLEGAALYFSINAFWIGLFASAAIIYVHKLQRTRAIEAERAVARTVYGVGESAAAEAAS